MTPKTFRNKEDEFDTWVKSHSFGLVINSRPAGLNPEYLIAHRPDCDSFQSHPGAKTVYSKHCFDSAIQAIEYLHNEGYPEPSFGCSKCKVSALLTTGNAHQLEESVIKLLARGFISPPLGNRTPRRVATLPVTLIQRDPAVVAWVRSESKGKCELCSANAPFMTADGRPYLEVHHVRTLAAGGADTIDNAVALCPNCHRSMHYSKSRNELVDEIYVRTLRLVR